MGVGILLNNIGNIHSRQRNYGLALDYHQKSLKLKEALSNKEGIAASLQNIGIFINCRADTTWRWTISRRV